MSQTLVIVVAGIAVILLSPIMSLLLVVNMFKLLDRHEANHPAPEAVRALEGSSRPMITISAAERDLYLYRIQELNHTCAMLRASEAQLQIKLRQALEVKTS